MKARVAFALLIALYLLPLSAPANAQKLKLGSGVRVNPIFFLTVMAGEEKGFWRENGLEVDHIPFEAGPLLFRAIAAKELFLGMDIGLNPIQFASRGVPVKIVSELDRFEGFFIYVLAKSPIREAKDIKGTRIGVPALGGAAHAYGQVMSKVLGLERDVKFVGAGGVPPMVAALKAGAIDAILMTYIAMTDLKVRGEVRDILTVDDYLPKPWISRAVFAHKDFIKEKPDIVRRTVRAMLQAASFWKKEASWAVAKMKATMGMSEEAAREIHRLSQPSPDGRIDRKAIENARAFMIEYGIIAKEKALSVGELYTDEFLRS